MISKEELLPKMKSGMVVEVMFNKFHNKDEGPLKLNEIDGSSLVWKRENGSEIIEILGSSYRYNYIDGKYIETLHNDRTYGWIVVEKKKIISGGQTV